MINFYLAGMTVLILMLLYCVIRAKATETQLKYSIIRLLLVGVLALLANMLYVTATRVEVAYVGFALFSICIDWLLFAMLRFVLEYTGYNVKYLPIIKMYILLAVADNISLLLGTGLYHFCYIEKRNVLGYDIWEASGFTFPYHFHLLGCYLISVHIAVILIRKILSASKYYRIRYTSILSYFAITLILDAVSVTLHMGMNVSILFYGFLAVAIYYYALKYIPGKLVADMQSLMMERLDSGIICFNEIGKCIYSNERMWSILGAEKNIAKAEELYHADGIAQRIFDTNDKTWNETHIVDGEERYVELSSHRMYDDGKHFVGCYYCITDRTKERRDYNTKINQEKASNRAKSVFLSQVSHEIRTPVNSIYGMNEMILRESTEESVLTYASQIKHATDTLIGIINDILDFSKIEAGRMEIVNREYQLEHILRNVCDMTKVKAEEKGLTFEIQTSGKFPLKLLGDDVRIGQILMNLLSNAVKYTAKGTVTLQVDWISEERDGALYFAVKDTGIGIKQEDIPNLFSAFQRMDTTKNHSIQGTGLGLSITKYLLDMMGSELAVESVYGQGSTFSCRVPQRVLDNTPTTFDPDKKAEPENQEYIPSFTAPWARVLVVDDNLVNRMVFRNLVKQTEVQVSEAESGAECLELIQKEHFDLIFMDHMMPEMDGVEAFREMNHMEHLCKDVPVIMLTANAIEGAMQEYLNLGFSDFLSKPIIPEKLETLMSKYLTEAAR